jgi:TetR/AcrR family transcriptional repressor of nem operon
MVPLNKKDAILESAQDLMLGKGFVATSIDEICEKAGVTKGSFFHYFTNKDQLGKELIDRFAEQNGAALMNLVNQRGADPLDRVLGYIDAAAEMCLDPKNKGCLVGTMTQELHQTHPEINGCCGRKFQAMLQVFRSDLDAAKAKYASDREIDLDGLAEMFVATLQGGIVLVKATKDHQIMMRLFNHYRRYVESLFKAR